MFDLDNSFTQDLLHRLSFLYSVDLEVNVGPVDIAFYGIESVEPLFIDRFIAILRAHKLCKDLVKVRVEEANYCIVVKYLFSKDIFFNEDLDSDLEKYESLMRDHSGYIEYSYSLKQLSVVLYEKSNDDKIIS